jgi:hypothetical protein
VKFEETEAALRCPLQLKSVQSRNLPECEWMGEVIKCFCSFSKQINQRRTPSIIIYQLLFGEVLLGVRCRRRWNTWSVELWIRLVHKVIEGVVVEQLIHGKRTCDDRRSWPFDDIGITWWIRLSVALTTWIYYKKWMLYLRMMKGKKNDRWW